jgi:hypothetical protein
MCFAGVRVGIPAPADGGTDLLVLTALPCEAALSELVPL